MIDTIVSRSSGGFLTTVPELAAEALGSYLVEQLNAGLDRRTHNVEHTMLVTLVGYEIMSGRAREFDKTHSVSLQACT
jgi:hypothetical protein